MAYSFPAALPEPELRKIASALLSRSVDKSLLLPAWVVQGYLEGIYAGSAGHAVGSAGAADPPALTLDEAAAELNAMADAESERKVGAAILPGLALALALAVARLVVRVLEA